MGRDGRRYLSGDVNQLSAWARLRGTVAICPRCLRVWRGSILWQVRRFASAPPCWPADAPAIARREEVCRELSSALARIACRQRLQALFV